MSKTKADAVATTAVEKVETPNTIELGDLLDNPAYAGLDVDYLKQVVSGLVTERGQVAAKSFLEQLKIFAGKKSEFDLGGIDFGDEEMDAAAQEGGSDPVRMATLVQSNTKRPTHVTTGVFFDKLTGEIVANTWDAENEAPRPVEGMILAFHMGRTMFQQQAGKSPVCWSKDGVVNRHGGLCKDCPHYAATTCTKQLIFLFVSKDFEHMFKFSFSKTGFKLGQNIQRFLAELETPFARTVNLVAAVDQNNKGSWFLPKVVVSKSDTAEWTGKACRILAECYMKFFRGVKEVLRTRHAAYKQTQGELVGATGEIPGSHTNQLSAASGQTVGVGNAFLSAGPGVSPQAAEQPVVDLSKLTGARKA